MTATAHDVAAMLIRDQHAAGRPLDKLQLQKLLYLVQGANLELWATPAFVGAMRAYRHGPVHPGVERTYRDLAIGSAPIDRAVTGHPDRPGRAVTHSARIVLGHFGSWTAASLQRHIERHHGPWHEARSGLPDDEHSSAEISLSAMAEWFARHGVDPDTSRLRPSSQAPSDRATTSPSADAARPSSTFRAEISPEVRAVVEQAVDRARATPPDGRHPTGRIHETG